MSIKVTSTFRGRTALIVCMVDNELKYKIILCPSEYRRPDYCVYTDYNVQWERWYRGFVIQVCIYLPKTETPTYESVVTLVEQLDVEVMWIDAIIDTSIDKGIDDAPSDQYEFPTLSEIVNYVHDITQKQIDNRNELRALGIIV